MFKLPSDFREQGTKLLLPVLDPFVRSGMSPNVITTIGFFVTMAAGLAFFYGNLQIGGALVLLGGFFDVVDGYVGGRRSG
jgi:CDP-diacylglycerol--glycerol-3-phosphate 3-phosphatidyltransferase